MKLKKGTQIQAKIESLNIKGLGIFQHTIENPHYSPNSTDRYHSKQNLTYNIAVDGLFPGDEALVEVIRSKKLYSEAKVIELTISSENRVPTKNNYAGISGATPLEALSYAKQLEFKQNEVVRILSNITTNQDYTVHPIIGMENPWFYRNKMQYSFGYTEDMQPTLGLHVKRRKYDIVGVTDCYLHEENINQIVNFFQQKSFSAPYDLTPYQHGKNQGDLRNLTTKSNKLNSVKQNMIVLEVSQNADLEKVNQLMNEFNNQFPDITSVYIEVVHVQKGTPTRSELIHLKGEKFIQETLTINNQTLQFNIGPHTFFQPNPSQAEKIYSIATSHISSNQDQIIYDLFCGTGTLGLSVAHKAKHIYGIDIEASSIVSAKQNQENNNISNATFETGDVFRVLPSLKWPTPDTVIVDPPRAGLHEQTLDFLDSLNPQKIIYVSCNIKTFAQNLAHMQTKGWILQEIQPVDQFPHTRHLEIVAVISKS